MGRNILLEKDYTDESLLDLEEDILEAIEESDLPKDEHGFHKVSFRITVEWID